MISRHSSGSASSENLWCDPSQVTASTTFRPGAFCFSSGFSKSTFQSSGWVQTKAFFNATLTIKMVFTVPSMISANFDFFAPSSNRPFPVYPPTSTHPEGKLRLLYEANPITMIAEQANGMATNGSQKILDIEPTSIHQRTPLIVGSQVEIEALQQELR